MQHKTRPYDIGTTPRALPISASFQRSGAACSYTIWGGVSGLFAILAVSAFYYMHPVPVNDPDTPAYVQDAIHILATGRLVDTMRLPGYPLLLAATFVLTGSHSLVLASYVQGLSFIGVAVETYTIACLVWHHPKTAMLCSSLFSTSVIILTHVQAILTEGLGMFLLTTLTVLALLYIRTARLSLLWATAACLVMLEMTRPEWIYLALPLCLWLVLVTFNRLRLRVQLPHVLAMIVLVNSVVGLYVYQNATQNHFVGVTVVQRINLLGKIMQYHMQNEAPPQYSGMMHLIDSYVSKGDLDPWHTFAAGYQPLNRDHLALGQQYAVAIVLRHPIQFTVDSFLLLWRTFYPEPVQWYMNVHSGLTPALTLWWQVSFWLLWVLAAFPVVVLLWVLYMVRQHHVSEGQSMLLTVCLLAMYGLTITTVGDYAVYSRLHTVFDPLLIVVVWGSLIFFIRAIASGRMPNARQLLRRPWWSFNR